MATHASDGSQSDVNAKISASSPGDTVTIPSGTFTWGVGGLGTSVNKAIILQGEGQGSTIINTTNGTNGHIFVSASATIRSFTINQNNSRLFVCGGGSGWRFCDLEVNGNSARMWDIDNCYGLVDHCNIYIPSEQIFMYGRSDAWTTTTRMGTEYAVYFENNTFSGNGYSDANANGEMVFRFNILTGEMKFDSHGVWSNSPTRSARFLEAYNNLWTAVGTGAFWATIEFRGGTGRFFFNSAKDNTFTGRGVLKPYEYGAVSLGGYFARYQGPDDYPIYDQVGVGKDQLPEPVYMWGNRKGGTYPSGGQMPIVTDWSDMPSDAIAEYRVRIGDAGATYTMDDIIVNGRDYFTEGDGGVTIGTRVQMDAVASPVTGRGFWVTDEGSWRAGQPGTSGRLYVYNGSAWALDYEPYTFPHPLDLREFTDPVVPEIPVFGDEITISGSQVEGSTLTATGGTAYGAPNPTYTYQWKQDGSNISGATGATYVLVNGDVGTIISVVKTATNTAGSDTSTASTDEISAFMGDILVLNQTANTDPVTELRKTATVGGAFAYELIQHSGPYPQQPTNGKVYAEFGSLNRHSYVFPGTITESEAVDAAS